MIQGPTAKYDTFFNSHLIYFCAADFSLAKNSLAKEKETQILTKIAGCCASSKECFDHGLSKNTTYKENQIKVDLSCGVIK